MSGFVRNCLFSILTVPSCIPTSKNESSCCFASLPAIDIVRFLDFIHSNRCLLVSHCFNLHLYFCNGKQCSVSFQVLMCLSIFSLVSCLFRSFAHLKKTGLFIFLWLIFQSSLSILDASPLCDMCFANIFCQPVACLFCRAEVFNVNKV